MITLAEIWVIVLAILYGLLDFIAELEEPKLATASKNKKLLAAFSKASIDVGFALFVFYAATNLSQSMDIKLKVALSVLIAVKLREQLVEEIMKRIREWKI